MADLIMSMSGVRGIVGENLHPEIALKMGMAFGCALGKGPIIVGGDTRTSHLMVKHAVISGLMSVGTDVIDIGKVPTPTVQQMIRHYAAQGGMVITASHNPIQWNGIKLMNSSGSFLEQDQYDQFMEIYNGGQFKLEAWDAQGTLKVDPTALDIHIQHILDNFDVSDIRKANLKVLIDANNGTGALADPLLLQKLGVQYLILNNEPNGHFAHDPEPLKRNLKEIMAALENGNYDIGFVQDADADRLVILDEKGRFIGEDYSLGLCVDYILSEQAQPNATVVVNLSTSKVIEHIANRHQAKVVYTKIGESHVTKGIKSNKAVVGGEGNGGVIYPKIGWGRDSLVGIVAALKFLAKTKRSVSQLVDKYPKYIMRREKITVSSQTEVQDILDKISAQFPGVPTDTQDGIKFLFPNAWVHARPSNTEPIVRIFIEAPTESEAKALFDRVSAITLVKGYKTVSN